MRWLMLASCLTACYAPDLADCTVACKAADDCAADQSCVKGRCRSTGVTCDGDPDPTPVARVQLRVEVQGPGAIAIAGIGRCDDHDNACMWSVPAGAQLRCDALPVEDKQFDGWTTASCAGQDASCTVTVVGATIVGARFE